MIDRNKRIARNTLILYVRMIFLMLINLYTSRVVLSVLGIEDYGIYNVIGGFVAMFGFLNSAMAIGTQRYLTFELENGNIEYLRKVFITSVNIHFLIALLIFVLAETFGIWFLNNKMIIPEPRLTAALWIYQFSVLSAMFMFISVPYHAVIIAHERMSAFAYISVIEALLKLAIVYLLLVGKSDRLIMYGLMMLCVQILLRLIYGIYCKRHFEESQYKLYFNGRLFREMLVFSGWNLWGCMSSITTTQGLNIVLNMFFGPSINAARGIAVQVQTAVNQFATNFQTALNPQIIKSYASQDLGYMSSLVFCSSRFSFYLLLCICMPILFEAEMLLNFWLKDVPAYSAIFLRLILCVSLINVMANPLMTSVQATGNVKMYQIVVGSVSMMVLPVAYIGLKLGGNPIFVFISELTICVISFVVRLFIVHSIIYLSLRKYFSDVILKCLEVAILSLFFPLAFRFLLVPSILNSILVCVVCVLSVCMIVFLVGLTAYERHFILSSLKLKMKYNG